MASYIVLEAPNGPNLNHSDTRFIADRFSALALIAPWLWLAFNRLWLWAVLVFAAQISFVQIAMMSGFDTLGMLASFGISILVALEGRNLIVKKLVANGWSEKAAIPATTLELAEQIYYGLYPRGERPLANIGSPIQWPSIGDRSPPLSLADPTGIFQYDVKGKR